jgi:hypothetical protein
MPEHTSGYIAPVGEQPLTPFQLEVVSTIDASPNMQEALLNPSWKNDVVMVKPDLEMEDWYSKLKEDELFNGPEGPAPRLCGLRRLARPFIRSEQSHVNALVIVPKQIIKTLSNHNGDGMLMSTQEVLSQHNFPMASVTFSITLNDGRVFSDSADAYYSNCNDLGLFPTAVASARAEARALRKVLGIRQHAAEEITDKDAGEELAPDDNGPIKPEQVKLIERMLTQQEGASLKDVLQNITTREVFKVEELTISEARKALRTLNDMKKKTSKKSKKEKQE